MRRGCLGLLCLLLLAGTAEAHSPIKGIGAFYNGMLHPLLVPAHLLALIAVGLLIGQNAPRGSRAALPAFAIALAIALLAGALGVPPIPELLLPILALVCGLAVALSAPIGVAVPVAAAAVAGLLVGLDSLPEDMAGRAFWLSLAGTGTGAFLSVTYIGGLAAWLDRPWQKIGVRVLGSWTAASAILVIALTFAPLRGAG
jgi:hydrogenase/urease accessory protein HupE